MSNWLSAPFESEQNSNLVMCSVRSDVAKVRDNSKFKYRIEVSWEYIGDSKGMPQESDGQLMEKVEDAINKTFSADPIAVLTGMYTGDNRRVMVFYTLSLHIFQKKFNEALGGIPLLPLSFEAYEDPDWEEYSEMVDLIRKVDEAFDSV